jgi:hypothetical protein
MPKLGTLEVEFAAVFFWTRAEAARGRAGAKCHCAAIKQGYSRLPDPYVDPRP